jgi:hypothetical protein
MTFSILWVPELSQCPSYSNFKLTDLFHLLLLPSQQGPLRKRLSSVTVLLLHSCRGFHYDDDDDDDDDYCYYYYYYYCSQLLPWNFYICVCLHSGYLALVVVAYSMVTEPQILEEMGKPVNLLHVAPKSVYNLYVVFQEWGSFTIIIFPGKCVMNMFIN